MHLIILNHYQNTKKMEIAILLWKPGFLEISVIVLIILLLFGAKKIPALFKSISDGMKEFKKEDKEQNNEQNNEPEKNK